MMYLFLKGFKMKKYLKISAASLAVAAMFTGCMGGKQEATAPAASSYVNPEFDGAPKWVLMPEMEGAMCALGSAMPNAGRDMSFQRTEAIAGGKDDLARQISTKVSNLFKSYKASTGSGTNATFDNASSSVSKQLASQTLNGAKAKDVWISKTGTMYVLVCMSNEPVKEGMEEAVKTSFKNDQALYQKFLAEKANGELDAELSKAAAVQ